MSILSRITALRRVGGFARFLAVLAWTACCCVGRAEVRIEGLEEHLLENALAHLRLDEEPCDAPEWRVRQQFEDAPDRLRTALQAFGHYEVGILSSLDFGEQCWLAAFTIRLGEPVRVRSVDFRLQGDAEHDAAFTGLIQRLELRPGDPLDHGTYERLKAALLELAIERGYADARFMASRLDVYPDQRAADVTLHFDSGRRYRFGDISFHQDVLSERLVRSYLDFRPGDPYDNRRLTGLYVALRDSGYFSTVDIRSLPPLPEQGEIPVDVTLTPGMRRLITYGAGFSTDTGPRVRIGQTNRRRNARGHQFGVNAQLSPVLSEVDLSYRFPYGDPRTEWVSFSSGFKREDTDTAFSESFEFGARRVVGRPGNWTRTEFLELLTEDFVVGEQAGRTRLLAPGLAWSRTRADNPIRPTNGSRLDLELRAASDRLGSDTTFFQTIARGKWIWSLPSSARILMRAEAGATAEDDFRALPPSVRFFAGGDNSVRGYAFKSLGPSDAEGAVIGGSSLVVGSFEYEHPLRERWSIAFFVDAGNAFEGSDFEAKTGAGLGIRWQSPLGPIRVDVGAPLDDDGNVRLHVSLGPDL